MHAGCRCENVVFVCLFLPAGCRKAANCQYKFTHKPKISIFATQGRLVVPTRVKFGRTKGHVGPLGYNKFHANRFTDVGTRPQNIRNSATFC